MNYGITLPQDTGRLIYETRSRQPPEFILDLSLRNKFESEINSRQTTFLADCKSDTDKELAKILNQAQRDPECGDDNQARQKSIDTDTAVEVGDDSGLCDVSCLDKKPNIKEETSMKELYVSIKEEPSETLDSQTDESRGVFVKKEIVQYDNSGQDLTGEAHWPQNATSILDDGNLFLCPWCDQIFSQSVHREHHMKICYDKKYKEMKKYQICSSHTDLCETSLQPCTKSACLDRNDVGNLSTAEICNTEDVIKTSRLTPLQVKEEKFEDEDISPEQSEDQDTRLAQTFSTPNFFQELEVDKNKAKDICHDSHPHSKNNPFTCAMCSKTFKSKKRFNEHMRRHSLYRPFKCEVCNKTFIFNSDLTRHRRIHSSERRFKCEMCSKTFVCKGDLTRHIYIHLSERPLKCEVCNKAFICNSDLNRHRQVHSSDRPFKCDLCKKEFLCRSSLTTHRKEHSSDQPFKCELCGKMFLYFSLLTRHKIIHVDDRTFKCEICGKSFKFKNTLTRHLKKNKCQVVVS